MADKKIILWKKNEKKALTLLELQNDLNFQYLHQLEVADFEEKESIIAKKSKDEEMFRRGTIFKEVIESGWIPKVSIRWINEDVGYGLFAEEDLKEKTYVGEYVGYIRKNNEHRLNNYQYAYPVLDFIGRNYVIDATCGNLIRFINHSNTPNLQPSYAFISGFYHLILTTIKPIFKDQQLCYNYGKQYWYVRSPPKTI